MGRGRRLAWGPSPSHCSGMSPAPALLQTHCHSSAPSLYHLAAVGDAEGSGNGYLRYSKNYCLSPESLVTVVHGDFPFSH